MTDGSPTNAPPSDAARVASWLEHELRLLEILQYRLDGLDRLLRAGRSDMVVRAVDEIEEVRDQLGLAGLHRDLAVSAFTADWSDTDFPTLSTLIDHADSSTASRLGHLQEALHETTGEIAALQERCAAAASDNLIGTSRN